MEFKTIQEACVNNAINYGKEFNVKIDEDFALLKLFEELGEFSQAVLINRKKSRPEKFISAEIAKAEVAKELADVIGMVFVNAQLLNIDLEEALRKKWMKK
ncbi:MAG TPA: MazG nucleotide pyrophosphohydrolase domain-containing protein [Candidatus Magasanikbacteria bacterium]|nr:MazG nucleotide pyrophosphohydrolase domain-containing protein [Candidatus Magasanikbacteria bacterium]